MSGANDEWLRSPVAKALMLVAFAMSLVLGTGFILLNTSPESEPGGLRGVTPLSDGQARDQVVESARQVVAAAHLQGVTGSSMFVSCTNLHDPPYQAAVYLNFVLPQNNPVKYIREVAAAMVAHGWQEAPAMGEHFGLKLTNDGVTATFHDNPDDPRFGSMRIYGECRNTADHRNDNPAWTDITDRLN